MGYATILSGGPDGRYSIALDYGESTRTALIAALNAQVADLTVKIATQQVKVTEADAREAAQRALIAVAQEDFILAAAALPPGSPKPSTVNIRFLMQALQQLQLAHNPTRLRLVALKFDLRAAQQRLNYWTDFTPTETRSAWCVDLTEDRAAGATVATVDIPGESNLLLIAPGARAWAAGDGVLTAREIMSPEQAFWNAAVLPGWQKYKPTYRWGTITAIDYDAETASVDLFDSISSAQSLAINQTSTLEDVPIEYMTCNSGCFLVDDRVVVQFTGQDWSNPKIIGFLDNPRPCNWPAIYASGGFAYFWSKIPATFDLLFTSTLDVRVKFDGGAWVAMTYRGGSNYTYESGSFVADATPGASLVINRVSDSGALGGKSVIGCFVKGIWPVPTPFARRVAEFAVYLGGRLVFNKAVTDRGWSGFTGYQTGSTTGEIALVSGSEPLTLLAYTLTAPPT